ncbi:MAG: hypothetical protein RIS73_1468, partial [Bacteroidota bacterium]
MISVAAAKEIINTSTVALPATECLLQLAVGKILAEDVYATTDIPAFPQSSMDGYAFLYGQWEQNKKLILEGEIAAGNKEKKIVAAGKAVRIFTGAPVPAGADTVVMQEKVIIDSSVNDIKKLLIEDERIQQGTNVRP